MFYLRQPLSLHKRRKGSAISYSDFKKTIRPLKTCSQFTVLRSSRQGWLLLLFNGLEMWRLRGRSRMRQSLIPVFETCSMFPFQVFAKVLAVEQEGCSKLRQQNGGPLGAGDLIIGQLIIAYPNGPNSEPKEQAVQVEGVPLLTSSRRSFHMLSLALHGHHIWQVRRVM